MPIDPDTEDRRPDHEREPEEESRKLFDDDDDILDDSVADRQMGLVDDEEDMYELALDDLRDMDGPDA